MSTVTITKSAIVHNGPWHNHAVCEVPSEYLQAIRETSPDAVTSAMIDLELADRAQA